MIAGLAIGYVIGELVSLATNRKAGPPLQAAAVGGVVLAYVVRTALLLAPGLGTAWTCVRMCLGWSLRGSPGSSRRAGCGSRA